MSDSESTQGTSSDSFNYRSFFLTYPRCSASRQDVLDHLCRLEPSWVYVTVGEELHEDGTPHCHALLCLSKKRDIRNPLHFDFQGHHCNVQPCRNVHDVLAYVQKVTLPFLINVRRIASSRLAIAQRQRALIGELLFRAVTPPRPSLL